MPDKRKQSRQASEGGSPKRQKRENSIAEVNQPQTSQKGVGVARTLPESELEGYDSSSELAAQRSEAARAADRAADQERLESLQQPLPIVEDIQAITAGTNIDLDDTTASAAALKERPAVAEERANVIRFHVVTNENATPESLIILTGLKNIFQKQLPKMPREYIARLVFDRNHLSMAIVKRGFQIVGGVTYRPFPQRGFGEIVFFAITGTEQVRGYGSYLMNHLKDYVRTAHPGIENFLTYADNYAVGYFKKQGFTKEVTLDRTLWAAYIKDYEGGTLMQCSMLPRIIYLETRNVLAAQKKAILAKLRLVSRSHIVHSGKNLWQPGVEELDPTQVPGLSQSIEHQGSSFNTSTEEVGWNPAMDELIRKPQRGPQHMTMQRVLTDMQNHASAWPFLKPVNKDEVADYYNVILNPMDLETMEVKLDANSYQGLEQFLADAQFVFDNCRQYNSESSNYVKNANKLEKYMRERVNLYTGAS